MQVPKEWATELDALVEKLPMHEFIRGVIRSEIVVTIARQQELLEQMPLEMLDQLARENPHLLRPSREVQ